MKWGFSLDNFIGDIGPTIIAPKEPAFGILYKWNKSPRHSYRISYTQSTIYSNDLDSDQQKTERVSFENDIKKYLWALNSIF
jgi:hypothetical protein